MDPSAKGKRPVRRVRAGGRGPRPVSQTPPSRPPTQAQGDPFAAVAQGEARPTPAERVFYCDTAWATYYLHRDLKHPVIVRRIGQ